MSNSLGVYFLNDYKINIFRRAKKKVLKSTNFLTPIGE